MLVQSSAINRLIGWAVIGCHPENNVFQGSSRFHNQPRYKIAEQDDITFCMISFQNHDFTAPYPYPYP